MAFDVNHVRDILLDELRAKGYAPNPADVAGAVKAIWDKVESHVADVIAEFKAAASLVKPEPGADAPPAPPKPQGAPTPPTA